jgi:Zn-dependent M28 family amino/carboxypeptidase
MDAKSDAPGANDDASGVAAMMELAESWVRENFLLP